MLSGSRACGWSPDLNFSAVILPSFFDLMGNPHLDRDVSIGNGWQVQNGDKLLSFGMPPGIAVFGLGVAGQVENFNLAAPDHFTVRYFLHIDGFAPGRAAIV